MRRALISTLTESPVTARAILNRKDGVRGVCFLRIGDGGLRKKERWANSDPIWKGNCPYEDNPLVPVGLHSASSRRRTRALSRRHFVDGHFGWFVGGTTQDVALDRRAKRNSAGESF